MTKLLALALIVCLAGCPPAYVNSLPNENSPFFQLPVGSELVLEQTVQVPAGRRQLYFQDGRTMDWHTVNIYLPHCTLKIASQQEAANPIHPDRFVVRRSYTERFFKQVRVPDALPEFRKRTFDPTQVAWVDMDPDGNMDYEVVAAVMELHSERQPEVTALICADWGLPQDTLFITVQKIRRSLGTVFSIRMPPSGK